MRIRHIDPARQRERGPERSVNAFQFDHPELHQYFADAGGRILAEEMSFAQKGGELIRRTSREAGDDEYIRTKRGVSERIARLLDDEGVRYDDIDRSLSADHPPTTGRKTLPRRSAWSCCWTTC